MKQIKVEEAVGMVLAHDLTKIVPGYKGAAFKKGYIIKEADIAELKNMGKNHLWVVELNEEQLHENDAARRIATAASSPKLTVSEALEGKANIKAAFDGVLEVNIKALSEINRIGKMALVTLHNNTVVKKDQIVAAAKIIPLTVELDDVHKAEQICLDNSPIIEIKPFFSLKTGIVVTGTEVYSGRIQDLFGEVLKNKINYYGGEFQDLRYAPDDRDFIERQILELITAGAEVILVSGGMAVDADDVTPQAIQNAATEVVTYGVPILPGSMCMIAYYNETAIIGVPGCAMFNKTTILDLVFPRILAKEHITRDEITMMGHGGICLQCETCRFPDCSFGK